MDNKKVVVLSREEAEEFLSSGDQKAIDDFLEKNKIVILNRYVPPLPGSPKKDGCF